MYLDFTQPPSKRLYRAVQAGFIANDTTLTSWCRQNGLTTQTAVQALCGALDSAKYRAVRKQIIQDVTKLASHQEPFS